MRWRSPHQRISQSISKRLATSSVEALLKRARERLGQALEEELGAQEELPPVGSEEYWCEDTTFAPRSNRKPDTAATMPGRSAQPISSRAV